MTLQIPEGYKLVPIESTGPMLTAGYEAVNMDIATGNIDAIWNAMVAAALPEPHECSWCKRIHVGYSIEDCPSGYSIPWRRSTDPESPTFEPTALIEMNGRNYTVHLDVWNEIRRLQSGDPLPRREGRDDDVRGVVL